VENLDKLSQLSSQANLKGCWKFEELVRTHQEDPPSTHQQSVPHFFLLVFSLMNYFEGRKIKKKGEMKAKKVKPFRLGFAIKS
jgi:hypothetical protein